MHNISINCVSVLPTCQGTVVLPKTYFSQNYATPDSQVFTNKFLTVR